MCRVRTYLPITFCLIGVLAAVAPLPTRAQRATAQPTWTRTALAVFQAGERAVPRFGSDPPYPSELNVRREVSFAYCISTLAAQGHVPGTATFECQMSVGAISCPWTVEARAVLSDHGLASAFSTVPHARWQQCMDAMLDAPARVIRRGEAFERFCVPALLAARDEPRALEAADVQAVVERGREELAACAEVATRPRDVLPERLDVAIVIAPRGRVSRVDVTGDAPRPLRACIVRSVRSWRFPRSRSETRTRIPVVFAQPEEGSTPPEDDARRVLMEHRSEVDACWADATSADAALGETRARLRLDVGSDGRVVAAAADGGPGVLRACLTRVASGWRFPEGAGDRTLDIPFRFVRDVPEAVE